MEIRKVQLTGKSSYTVSLPKAWASRLGLKEHSRVAMTPLPDGSLKIMPSENVKRQERGRFSIEGLLDDALARYIIAIYIAGYETFELTARKIRAEQRRTIRDMSYRLIGMEIVEETATTVVIQDFSSPNELQVKKSIRRMYLIAESMYADAVASLLKGDADLANDVILRDRDVDRHYLLVLKRLQSLAKSPFAETSDIAGSESLEYYLAAVSLERIADHATTIAQSVLALNHAHMPPDLLDAINKASGVSSDTLRLAMEALSKLDTMLAERAIETKNMQIYALQHLDAATRELDPHIAVPITSILNSIDRIADYGMNIAEVAINLTVASA